MSKAFHYDSTNEEDHRQFSAYTIPARSTDSAWVQSALHPTQSIHETQFDMVQSGRQHHVNQWYSQQLGRMNDFEKVTELDGNGQWFQDQQIAGNDDSAVYYAVSQEGTAQWRHRRHSDLANRLPRMINSSLDPFINVTVDVTPRQRSLIQFYMKDLAAILFGVSDTAIYSPTGATGVSFLGDSKVAISWMCILAEGMMNTLRGVDAGQALIQQKAQGYQQLKQAIVRRGDDFQEAMMGVAIVGLFQYGFGDTYSQDLHTTMADRLIRGKPTMEDALRSAPRLEPFYFAAQFAFGRTRIDSLHEFETIRQEWLMTMEAVFGDFILSHDSGIVDVLEYRNAKDEILQITHLALVSMHRPSCFAQAMRLAMLNELAWTVLDFQKNVHLITRFFRRLSFICQHSMIGSDGCAQNELKAAAVGSMVSRARRDVILEVNPESVLPSDARVTSKHITAMKMFNYLGQESQDMILSSLLQWLELNDVACTRTIGAEVYSNLECRATESWRRYNQSRRRRTQSGPT